LIERAKLASGSKERPISSREKNRLKRGCYKHLNLGGNLKEGRVGDEGLRGREKMLGEKTLI